ncbi:Hsp33 family molecular chaperone HslO, partial [Staphylococcus epidermidis]|uniref:Hsp33 family molecular chaperone HslO n=1 Tax=Staphylococcus epidermidis TaxID=1282 RepID=UPI0016432FA0
MPYTKLPPTSHQPKPILPHLPTSLILTQPIHTTQPPPKQLPTLLHKFITLPKKPHLPSPPNPPKTLPNLQILNSTSPQFQSNSSHHKFLNPIKPLPHPQIHTIIKQHHGAQPVSHFCANKYQYS